MASFVSGKSLLTACASMWEAVWRKAPLPISSSKECSSMLPSCIITFIAKFLSSLKYKSVFLRLPTDKTKAPSKRLEKKRSRAHIIHNMHGSTLSYHSVPHGTLPLSRAHGALLTRCSGGGVPLAAHAAPSHPQALSLSRTRRASPSKRFIKAIYSTEKTVCQG